MQPFQLVLREPESPDAYQTALRSGISTKRHEFLSSESTGNDAFVVFEGEENTPFWRREGDGVRFVYTTLTYAQAVATAEQSDSFLRHHIFDTDGGEFVEYYRQAWENHVRPR